MRQGNGEVKLTRTPFRLIRLLEIILTYGWVVAVAITAGVLLAGCGGSELRSVRGDAVFTLPQHIDLCKREPEAALCPKQ